MTEHISIQDLIIYTCRLGDDALIHGHRISEWVSHAPFLEEDIALGNVALDFIGHAQMYYDYAAKLSNEKNDDKAVLTQDDFAYLRDERDFQNHLIHELPKGNFAESIVSQLIVDVYNKHYLTALIGSKDDTLSAIAQKAIKEVTYHSRRSKEWAFRLGDGTQESHQKMQVALDNIWGYIFELFEQDDVEKRLVNSGVAVNTNNLKLLWTEEIKLICEQATLTLPTTEWAIRGGRAGYHTENLGHILTEMQFVHRSFPGAKW